MTSVYGLGCQLDRSTQAYFGSELGSRGFAETFGMSDYNEAYKLVYICQPFINDRP